jgi:hypothetical protein
MQNATNHKLTDQEDLDSRVHALESQLQSIIDRNNRVEAEKAWETSNVRRLSIVAITYMLMSLVLTIIGVNNPFINAVVPTLGYYLSTLYLKSVKETWITRNGKLK